MYIEAFDNTKSENAKKRLDFVYLSENSRGKIKAEQEKAELPPAHAQCGHQQRGYHAEEDVFDVGHASTAFLVAGSSPRIASVSSISHQKVGLAGEVSGQKQPTVQSRYSANAKHSTPM